MNQFAEGSNLLIQITNVVDAGGNPTVLTGVPVWTSSDASILALNPAADDARRGTSRERGYSRTWEKARRMWLRRNPWCADPFGLHSAENRPEAATLVDHIVDHKGDRGKFWDPDNLQSLCAHCHARKTFEQNPPSGARLGGVEEVLR